MARILHVCNWFDPAGDAVRCVRELRRFSAHEHRLIVHDDHPYQSAIQFPTEPKAKDPVAEFRWADGIIFHFVGWDRGWRVCPDKPRAFRNLNIRLDGRDKFWAENQFNATNISSYKLLASSHSGAGDFLPNCKFLPDLIPVDEYTPDFSQRPPCISYIKHADELDKKTFLAVKLRLFVATHSEILRRRKHEATCVIDNVCDGHYGLAGLEALSLGLATVVYNHQTTQTTLRSLAPEYPPFIECSPNLDSAVSAANSCCNSLELRRESRRWMETYYHSQRIIDMYWDPFCSELVG